MKPNVPGADYHGAKRRKRTKSTCKEREETTSAAPVLEPPKGDSSNLKQSTGAAPVLEPPKGDSSNKKQITGAVPRRSSKPLKEVNQANSTFAAPRAGKDSGKAEEVNPEVKADDEVKPVDLENTSAVPPVTKTVKVEIPRTVIAATEKTLKVHITGDISGAGHRSVTEADKETLKVRINGLDVPEKGENEKVTTLQVQISAGGQRTVEEADKAVKVEISGPPTVKVKNVRFVKRK